ncbi:MAG: HdeD family acid-resistance protein [Caldimonas sp.]
MNAAATGATGPSPTRAQMDAPARMLMLRGAIAILFGVLAIVWPDLTLLLLVALFAAYALLSGGVSIVAAVRSRGHDSKWWLPLLLGLVSIAAGICAVVYPALTALVLVLLIGANAFVTGVLDIAIAIRLRPVLRGHWLLVLTGTVSILFGVLVFTFPGAGALALIWLISLYAVVTGVLLLTLGLRTLRADHEGGAHPVAAASGR